MVLELFLLFLKIFFIVRVIDHQGNLSLIVMFFSLLALILNLLLLLINLILVLNLDSLAYQIFIEVFWFFLKTVLSFLLFTLSEFMRLVIAFYQRFLLLTFFRVLLKLWIWLVLKKVLDCKNVLETDYLMMVIAFWCWEKVYFRSIS